MGELVQRGSYTSVLGGGLRANKPLKKEMERIQGRGAIALREIEVQGEVTRAADVEAGKRVANQMDVTYAAAAHLSERHVEFVQFQRDQAGGDAGLELELAPIRTAVLRKNLGLMERLYGPLG